MMNFFIAYFLYYDNGKLTKVRRADGFSEPDVKTRAVKILKTNPRFALDGLWTLPESEDDIIAFFENEFSGDFDIEQHHGQV